ncbi:Calcineurin-like phosphoesterase, partial [Globisporangium splendens]
MTLRRADAAPVALLPRWRSSSYEPVAPTDAQDDGSGRRARSSSSSSHTPSFSAQRRLVLGCIAAALGLVGLVAWSYGSTAARAFVGNNARTNAMDGGETASSHKRIQLQLQDFSVAPLVLNQRDTLHVRFAYTTQTAADVADGDWIGAYCVDDELKDVNVHDPIDSRSTHGAVEGTVVFGPMVNMRCSWQLKFVSADGVVLATSPFVRFAKGPTEPLQIHLAMTNDSTQMRVHWTSSQVREPVVLYGPREDELRATAHATHTSYKANDMCREPATIVSAKHYRDPGQLYDALLTDLEPEQTYWYRVGDANGQLSAIRNFTVPPRAGTVPEQRSMSFFVFGDLNSPVGATENFAVEGSCGTTLELMEQDLKESSASKDQHKYVAVMHVGDISYAKGSTYIWDQFGELIQNVASTIPYMVSIGNHDYGYLEGNEIDPIKFPRNRVFEGDGTHGYQSYGECGVPTDKRFHMPDNGNSVFWYSVDMGLVHHTVLSGEHDFSEGSPMYEWLLNDLMAVDRTKTPWLFVHMHRPMYCSVAYAGDYERSLLYRDHLEQMFSDFHVDVVFSGHYHSYERTCAVFDEICYEEDEMGGGRNAFAPVHVMVGSGGANVDQYDYYNVGWRKQAFLTYGYGRVHVYNASHMHFEFVSNKERAVTDATWIVSDHNWPTDRVRRYRPSLLVKIVVGVMGVVLVVGGVTWWWRRRRRALKWQAMPYFVRKTKGAR